MPDPQTDITTQKSQGLEEAFDLFIEASKALEAQQSVLQGQLTELSGQLIAANSIPIFIPCHRVIGTDGTLTGYRGGLALKKQLLELEESCR